MAPSLVSLPILLLSLLHTSLAVPSVGHFPGTGFTAHARWNTKKLKAANQAGYGLQLDTVPFDGFSVSMPCNVTGDGVNPYTKNNYCVCAMFLSLDFTCISTTYFKEPVAPGFKPQQPSPAAKRDAILPAAADVPTALQVIWTNPGFEGEGISVSKCGDMEDPVGGCAEFEVNLV
ncbi:MAG: hypothetical protein M1833_004046 [Piccolia ochrophora]|nr:MAG: hypothetical protein M1833_004046 [Piccolia ochrophora]